MNKEEYAKSVWDYKDKKEREEELERERFNECYDNESKELRKELGFFRWAFMWNSWEKISKRALVIYEKRYGKLKDMGEIKRDVSSGGEE